MTTYSSKPVTIEMPVAEVYARCSNIGAFQERIDTLPEEVRSKIGSVRFTDDSIVINAAPMGDMTLNVTERRPDSRVALTAANAPVPLVLSINLEPDGDSRTRVVTAIEVEIPAMLRPMVGPKLQEAAEKFGDMIKNIATA